MTKTETVGTALPPVTGFDDTGLPAWQEIRRLVDDEAPNLSQHVRDELAGMLVWARYGKLLASRTQSPAADDRLVEAIADELVAHGEFSSIPSRNHGNAVTAARAVLRVIRAASIPAPEPAEWPTDEQIWAAHDKLWEKRTAGQFAAVRDALLAASMAPPAPERSKEETGVRVKPLEWKGPDENTAYGEQGGFIYTVMSPNRTPGWRVWVHVKSLSGMGGSVGGVIVTMKAESREAAFAAAQADYEQRILSALETPPLHKEGETK